MGKPASCFFVFLPIFVHLDFVVVTYQFMEATVEEVFGGNSAAVLKLLARRDLRERPGCLIPFQFSKEAIQISSWPTALDYTKSTFV